MKNCQQQEQHFLVLDVFVMIVMSMVMMMRRTTTIYYIYIRVCVCVCVCETPKGFIGYSARDNSTSDSTYEYSMRLPHTCHVRPSPDLSVIHPKTAPTIHPFIQPSPTLTIHPFIQPRPTLIIHPLIQPGPTLTIHPFIQPSPTLFNHPPTHQVIPGKIYWISANWKIKLITDFEIKQVNGW